MALGERVTASVTLGAVPDGDQCSERWELVVPTSSATSGESSDAVLRIDYPVEASDWESWRCVHVSLTSTDPTIAFLVADRQTVMVRPR